MTLVQEPIGFRLRICAAILTAVVCCGGCGGSGSGVPRFNVSGKVVFNGSPVSAGQIVFEPDLGAGNSGPAGYADIVDGLYDTAKKGQGTVGGPHLVRITGLTGQPTDNGTVNPLFKTYEVKVDLAKSSSTQDFEVPASAADGLKLNEPT